MDEDAPGLRIPLRWKLIALLAPLTLLPVGVVGLVLTRTARSGLEAQVEAFQIALAGEVASSLENQLTDAEDALDAVGRILMSEAIPEEAAVDASLRIVEGVRALDHVAIYDEHGALVDVVRERGARMAVLPDELEVGLRDEAAERGVALGPPSADDVAARLWVVIPLRPEPGSPPTAFAASRVSLQPLQDHVEHLAADRASDRRQRLEVLDAEYRRVASSNGMEGEASASLADHPLVENVERSRFRSAFGQQRVYVHDGVEQLGTLTSVPSRGWAIIVQIPTEAAFAPVRTMEVVVVSSAAAVALAALLLGLWVARSLTHPIAALVELADKLGRRELGTTVEVETRDELRTLGAALSRASVDLAASELRIRQEEAIRSDLGRYLPREVVERVVEREQDMALGGERREITVLFADVVGFTPLAEAQSPEVVVSLLNELFTILTEIVFRHGGTVDKFVGDCVMAMWNAPSSQPDHATRAIAAAEDMVRWLESGAAHWREQHGVEIRLAIGVHTGEAVVGNVGSETRMAYTAIGDVVNVAARLEAIARPQQILITRETRDAAGELFDYLDAGERELAGRRGSVHLYEVSL